MLAATSAEMAQLEGMPKLVMRTPPPSPREYSRTIHFEMSDDRSCVIDFQIGDREQRRSFLDAVEGFACRLVFPTIQGNLLPILEQLIEYDDCAPRIARLLPVFVKGAMLDQTQFPILIPTLHLIANTTDVDVVAELVECIERLFCVVADECKVLIASFIHEMAESPYSSHRAVGASTLHLPAMLKGFQCYLQPNTTFNEKGRFLQLCQDQDVVVRRAACRTLRRWVDVLGSNSFPEFPLPVFNYFLTDELHDTIQIALAHEIAAIACCVAYDTTRKYLRLPYVELCRHRSWRVRFSAAQEFSRILKALRGDASLTAVLLTLVDDEEIAVASASTLQLGECAAILGRTIAENVLAPKCMEMLRSAVARLRSAALFAAKKISSAAGSDHSMVELVSSLCEDEDEWVAISAVSVLSEVLTEHSAENRLIGKQLERLVAASESPRWRVRAAFLQSTPALSSCLPQDVFETLSKAFVQRIDDSVHVVRIAAIHALSVTARSYGSRWTSDVLCSLIEGLSSVLASHYAARITALLCIEALLPFCDGDGVEWLRVRLSIEAVVRQCSSDSVSNVRLILARMVRRLRGRTCASELLEESFHILCEDGDADVRRELRE